MVKGFKKKNKKGGHDFIPTEKDVTRDISNTPNTEVNIEIDNNSDDFSEGVRKDFENKNTDEHGITLDVIKELQELEDDKDISIEEVDDGMNTVSGVGKYLTLSNGATWNLFSSYDEMEEEAKARIRQDLDEEEMFNQDFIDSHSEISDTDARMFGIGAGDSAIDGRDLDELKEMADDHDIDYEEKFPEPKYDDSFKSKEDFEDAYEKYEEKLESYLQDEISSKIADDVEDRIKRYGLRKYIVDDEGLTSDEDFQKDYGKWLVLDVDSAIDDAISSDGVEHFISGYDGEVHQTKDGQYLVKHND